MSSVTTATVSIAVTVEKAPRKFPPPCWTQQEAISLIDAYRDRWYALRRGYLRTADWEAVAAAVASLWPGASPPKTSAQCRHKIEKLRQRYRAEKQRVLSCPNPAGRLSPPWFFFEHMEAMENGTASLTSVQNHENSTDGSRLNSFLDHNIMKLKLKAENDADSSPDLGFDNGVRAKRFNCETKASIDYPPYTPPLKCKAKNSSRLLTNFDCISPGLRVKELGKLNYRHWANVNQIAESRETMSGLKRGRNVVEDMVASIRFLGEGFVKMERAKMEMAREMEEMRMEMEMKRNEMLIETQKQIVDAIVKGLFELKQKKKLKTGTQSLGI